MTLLFQPWAILLAWTGLGIYLVINSRRIPFLKRLAPLRDRYPSAAIIVAVRNEEDNIGAALQSICRQDYPGYEVIVINDRSTDRTGEVLAAALAPYQHAKLITIDALPPGWMGKQHALHQGWKQCRGSDYLLFTDIDVDLAPDALSKAVGHCMRNGIDLLAVLPEVCSRSAALNRILDTFRIFIHLRYRPWAVGRPRSKAFFGIGAFNLVRREAYEAAGTHEALALHPNDDIALGEVMHGGGSRQAVLYGQDMVRYEWYRSAGDFVRGLMKNTFSAFNYSLGRLLPAAAGALLLFVMPLPVLLLSGNAAWAMAGLALLGLQGLLVALLPGRSGPPWGGLLMAADSLVVVYIMLASAVRTLRQGGIWWREHFYALPELRAALKGMRARIHQHANRGDEAPAMPDPGPIFGKLQL